MNRPVEEKARHARLATLLLLALLLLTLVLETLVQVPASMQVLSILFILAVKTAPLALFFRPIQKRRAMSAVWLGFVLMLYFCWAVLGLSAPGIAGRLALVRLLLIAGCFAAAMLFTRWERAAQEN